MVKSTKSQRRSETYIPKTNLSQSKDRFHLGALAVAGSVMSLALAIVLIVFI